MMHPNEIDGFDGPRATPMFIDMVEKPFPMNVAARRAISISNSTLSSVSFWTGAKCTTKVLCKANFTSSWSPLVMTNILAPRGIDFWISNSSTS